MAVWPTHRAKASQKRYRRRYVRKQAQLAARLLRSSKVAD